MRVRCLPVACLALLVSACGSDKTITEPGETQPGSDAGSQPPGDKTSEEDPTAGGAPSMEDTGRPGDNFDLAGAGSTGSVTPSAPSPIADGTQGAIGSACASNNDCLTDLECLTDATSLSGSGEVAQGICTVACTAETFCTDYDGLTSCYLDDKGTPEATDDEGQCFEHCVVGEAVVKCRANLNQMCTPLTETGEGLCLPFCFDDQECGGDLHCSPVTGACEKEEAPGKAVGESCTADEDCQGQVCLAVTDDSGVCSSYCAFVGEMGGCGVSRDEELPQPGVCLPLYEYFGSNDPGICYPLCDVDNDCNHPELRCELFEEEEVELFGRTGICEPGERTGPAPDGSDAGTPPIETTGDASTATEGSDASDAG